MAETTGTETPSNVSAHVTNQAATVNTEAAGAVTDIATTTESPATSKETTLSTEDEIRRDLEAARPKTESGEDDKDSGAETGEEDDLPDAVKAARDDYLKKQSDLAEREAAIAAREAALETAGKPTGDKPADATDTKTQETQQPALMDRWTALKAEIQDAWENADMGEGLPKGYEAPGERKLVDFLDAVVPELSDMREAFAYVQHQARMQEATSVAESLHAAAGRVKEVYGIDVDPIALAGMAEKGGVAAVAAAKGVEMSSLRPSPDLFLEVYEIANAAALRELRTKPKETPKEPKKPLPDAHRGGGARTTDQPQTEEEQILADMRAVQAGRTVR